MDTKPPSLPSWKEVESSFKYTVKHYFETKNHILNYFFWLLNCLTKLHGPCWPCCIMCTSSVVSESTWILGSRLEYIWQAWPFIFTLTLNINKICCRDQLGDEVPEGVDGRLRKTQTQFKEKQGPGGALSSDGETMTLNMVSAFIL